MNKKKFRKMIMDEIKDLPLEKKEAQLLKIQKEWIPSIREDMLGKYKKCHACGKYFLPRQFKKQTSRENRIMTTYTDCGYGDDDRHGLVECLVTYETCPGCGKSWETECLKLRILWEKNRWGEKV